MKRFFVIVVICILGLMPLSAQPQQSASVAPAVGASATTSSALPEPEWSGVVYQLIDGTLTPIERQVATAQVKSNTFYGGGQVFYAIKNVKSSTRITSSLPVFVVKLESGVDPTGRIKIERLMIDEKNNSRKILVTNMSNMGNSKAIADTSVELKYEKYGTSIKFYPASPLPKGEYQVKTGNMIKVSLFGMD